MVTTAFVVGLATGIPVGQLIAWLVRSVRLNNARINRDIDYLRRLAPSNDDRRYDDRAS